jgi:hypothetical protein
MKFITIYVTTHSGVPIKSDGPLCLELLYNQFDYVHRTQETTCYHGNVKPAEVLRVVAKTFDREWWAHYTAVLWACHSLITRIIVTNAEVVGR